MTTDLPIIPWFTPWTTGRRDPAPAIRAFVHHHSADVPAQFEYVGPAVTPGDDGLDVPGLDRYVVNIQRDGEKLTVREARLVARALAAGRNIERAMIAREGIS